MLSLYINHHISMEEIFLRTFFQVKDKFVSYLIFFPYLVEILIVSGKNLPCKEYYPWQEFYMYRKLGL